MKNLFKKVLTVMALAIVTLSLAGAVKASAATLEYNAATDSITGSGVAYIMKNAETAKLKASAEAITLSTTAQTLTELGCKEGNAVYFYIADAAITEDKEVKANKVIAACKGKKITGVIDYTKADANAADVLTANVIDKDKKAVTDLVVYWSEDGEAYSLATDTTKGLTGSYLKSKLEAGATIYIKVVDNTNTTRTSKAVKVKIAKQAKAPSVKLDVKKNSINIKNGFDFGLAAKQADETYTVATWYTVLPYLKTAATKTAADSVVATTSYRPLTNKDANATKVITDGKVAFTSYKFKAVDLDTIVNSVNTGVAEASKVSLDTGFTFAVRKSATAAKPASAMTVCEVKAQAKAPQLYTLENTSSYKVIAEGEEFKFKAPTIVNSVFLLDTDKKEISAWAGIGEDAKVAETGTKVEDTAAAKYEMAVVKVADLTATEAAKQIDWSTVSWKGVKAGAAINDKTKSTYCLKGSTTKITATLKAGTTEAGGEKKYGDSETVLLIRRAGVKGKTVGETVIASKYITTYVYKNATPKKYYWNIIDGEALVGADAFKYVITVKTWQKGESAYAWTADATKTITGYQAVGAAAKYTLEDPEGCEYDTSSLEGATASNKELTIGADDTAKDATVSVSINLKQKATIKVKYAGLPADKKIEDAEVELILGVATDITGASYNKIPTVEGYVVDSVTNATDKKTVTVNTDKDVITVTYNAAN